MNGASMASLRATFVTIGQVCDVLLVSVVKYVYMYFSDFAQLCVLMTQNSSVKMLLLCCSCCAAVVLLSCSCCVRVMQLLCSCHAAVVLLSCSCCAPVMQLLCCCWQLSMYDQFKQLLLSTGVFQDNIVTHFSASFAAVSAYFLTSFFIAAVSKNSIIVHITDIKTQLWRRICLRFAGWRRHVDHNAGRRVEDAFNERTAGNVQGTSTST